MRPVQDRGDSPAGKIPCIVVGVRTGELLYSAVFSGVPYAQALLSDSARFGPSALQSLIDGICLRGGGSKYRRKVTLRRLEARRFEPGGCGKSTLPRNRVYDRCAMASLARLMRLRRSILPFASALARERTG